MQQFMLKFTIEHTGFFEHILDQLVSPLGRYARILHSLPWSTPYGQSARTGILIYRQHTPA